MCRSAPQLEWGLGLSHTSHCGQEVVFSLHSCYQFFFVIWEIQTSNMIYDYFKICVSESLSVTLLIPMNGIRVVATCKA